MESDTKTLSRHSLDDEAVISEKHDEISSENSQPQSLNPTTKNDELTSTAPVEETWEYVTGLKLAAVISAVTATVFTLLLDISIVVTVSGTCTSPRSPRNRSLTLHN